MVTRPYLVIMILFLSALLTVNITAYSSHALQDEYFQEEYHDPQVPEYPEYEEPLEEQGYDEFGDQNPDPEFMEQVEPGEYDESDDTTILDDNSY